MHHWDSDGIASAVIISKHIGAEKKFIVPRIGSYTYKSINIESIVNANPDLVVLVDYGISISEAEELRRNVKCEVAIVDHHLNKPGRNVLVCNPLAYGESSAKYPSTTWVIREYLGFEDPGKTVLGIVGDVGWNIRDHSVKTYVLRFMDEHRLSRKNLKKAVEHVDSCYKLVDYECISYARIVLAEKDVIGVLEDKLLAMKAREVREEMWKAIEESVLLESRGPIKVFSTKSKAYVTSSIGRFLAEKNPEDVVVIKVYVEKLGLVNIYVRSLRYKVGRIISMLKSKGFNVGGKDHVFSIVCGRDCDEKLKTVVSVLEKQLGGLV